MKVNILIPLALFLCSCSLFQPPYTPSPHQSLDGKASYVIDGETFYFSFDQGKFKARLAGIHAPGMKEKYGKESFEFLRGLVHQKNVRIEFLETDPDGRWIVNAKLATGENIQDQVQAYLSGLPANKPTP